MKKEKAKVSKAVEKLRIRAEKGDAEAQYELGDCYLYGRGVANDASEAVRWYSESAEQGHAPAQYKTGMCYEKGLGTRKNYVEAIRWYAEAAGRGNHEAQKALYRRRGIGKRTADPDETKGYNGESVREDSEPQSVPETPRDSAPGIRHDGETEKTAQGRLCPFPESGNAAATTPPRPAFRVRFIRKTRRAGPKPGKRETKPELERRVCLTSFA